MCSRKDGKSHKERAHIPQLQRGVPRSPDHIGSREATLVHVHLNAYHMHHCMHHCMYM